MMLFSITGTKEVFSFIASSGIRLLCFFVNIARSLISAAKHFREKQQDTRKRRRPKCGEKKKKKKGRRVQIGMRYRGEAKRKMAVVE